MPTPGGDDEAPFADEDVFKTIGVVSPACKKAQQRRVRLDRVSRENCRRSGQTAIPQDTTHFGLDTHIDFSLKNLFGIIGAAFSWILNGCWALLVLGTQLLCWLASVAFEFSITDEAFTGQLARTLNRAKDQFTTPLLEVAFGVAAVILAWSAAVRGRIAAAVGGGARSFALVVTILILLSNPVGLIGGTNQVANKLALGVLNGLHLSIGRDADGYKSGLAAIVNQILIPPWGLLEFSDPEWATNPTRLDQDLKKTAVTLAKKDVKTSERGQRDKTRSALKSVTQAKTNADLFLAWPAGSPQRNSINLEGGLYRELCGADEDKKCAGKTAKQAKARQGHNTIPRILQFLVISPVTVCVWLLLFTIVFALIASQIAVIIYTIQLLVIAPVACLGENGRFAALKHLKGLVGSVFAQTYWAFYLVSVLLVFDVLATLKVGWLLQWVLLAVAMVVAFQKRKAIWTATTHPTRAGENAIGRVGMGITRTAIATTAGIHAPKIAKGAAKGVANLTKTAAKGAASVTKTAAKGTATVAKGTASLTKGAAKSFSTSSGGGQTTDEPGDQNAASSGGSESSTTPTVQGSSNKDLRARQNRLLLDHARTAKNQHQTTENFDKRQQRAAQLDKRAAQLDKRAGQLDRELANPALTPQQATRLKRDRQRVENRRDQLENTRKPVTAKKKVSAGRWLDEQAAIPRGNSRLRESRDYPRLAALTGQTPREYQKSPPAAQLKMRNQIDGQLKARTQTQTAGPQTTGSSDPDGRVIRGRDRRVKRSEPTAADSFKRRANRHNHRTPKRHHR